MTRAGIEPTAAAPSQPTRLDVSRSDHSAVSFEAAEWSERLTPRRVGWLGAAAVGSIPALVTFFSFSSPLLLFLSSLSKTYISPLYTKLFLSWRFSAAFLLSLAPVRLGCSLFLELASFPSFSLWPTPIDRVSSNRCLKARHEAVSFEAAEWSERLTSRRVGWLGAAAVGSIPALVTFFSFSSLLLLFLSSLSKVRGKLMRSNRCRSSPGSRSIYMLSAIDFDPKGTISEVRVLAGALFGHTGWCSIAKCNRFSMKFSRSFDHHDN